MYNTTLRRVRVTTVCCGNTIVLLSYTALSTVAQHCPYDNNNKSTQVFL